MILPSTHAWPYIIRWRRVEVEEITCLENELHIRALDLFLVGNTNCIIYNIIHLFGGNGSDLDVPVKIQTISSNKVHVAELCT